MPPIATANAVHLRLLTALEALREAEGKAVLLFAEVLRHRLYLSLGYPSMETYARNSLRFSRAKTMQFLRLAQALNELPRLRESVRQGKTSWTKARIVAAIATPRTEEAWVHKAETHSRRELEATVRLVRATARMSGNGHGLGLMPEDATENGGGEASASAAPADDPAGNPGGAPDSTLGSTPEDEPDDPDPSGGLVVPKGGGPAPNGGSPASIGSGPASNGDGAKSVEASQSLTGANSDTLELAMDVPVTKSLRFSAEQASQFEALQEALRKKGFRGTREDMVLAALECLAVRVTGTGSGAHESNVGSTGNGYRAGHQILVHFCPRCRGAEVQAGGRRHRLSPPQLARLQCDADIVKPGERMRAVIPPSLRREILMRDNHTCQIEGCNNTLFLEVHHIVHREHGGTNAPGNLVTVCSNCHRFMHEFPEQFSERRLDPPPDAPGEDGSRPSKVREPEPGFRTTHSGCHSLRPVGDLNQLQ